MEINGEVLCRAVEAVESIIGCYPERSGAIRQEVPNYIVRQAVRVSRIVSESLETAGCRVKSTEAARGAVGPADRR